MPCSTPVALALLLVLPGSALAARTVALRNDPIAIRLEVHQPTAVVFPEAVAAVPTGADPARLSLDYDGPYLFLQPREPGVSGRLFVVGASGRLYGLRFAVATPADDMVTIKTPAASGTAAPSRPIPPLDLLKALRFGTALPGVTPITLPPFQSPDARVQVLGQQALALDVSLGVVVTITNVHPEPLELDLRVGVPSTTPVPATLVSLDGWPLPRKVSGNPWQDEHDGTLRHDGTKSDGARDSNHSWIRRCVALSGKPTLRSPRLTVFQLRHWTVGLRWDHATRYNRSHEVSTTAMVSPS